MATLLTITPEEILRLGRLDTSETANLDEAETVIADEQEAIEATLRPDALTDESKTALLRRNVAKLLAAEFLEARGREEGASGSFEGLGLSISAVPDHAGKLREEANQSLLPYRRATAFAIRHPAGESPQSLRAQAERFGALP